MPEPRDPLLKVLIIMFVFRQILQTAKSFLGVLAGRRPCRGNMKVLKIKGGKNACGRPNPPAIGEGGITGRPRYGNDPSEGSPTETLLRLLLPLNDRV